MEADRTHHPLSPVAAALALTMALAGAGCATVRAVPPATGMKVPDAWAQGTGAARQGATGDLSAWWQNLRDPLLSELIDTAMKANLDVRTAQARLRQARAQRNLADANRFPSVSATGSARGSRTGSPGSNSGSYSAGFDASWEPDIFGAQRLALQASEAELLATAADLDAVRVSLAAEVALGYVDLRSSQARLEIARRNEISQSETLQIVEWRAQAGLVSEVDVAQARTNREQTRAQLPALAANVTSAQHGLAILLGLAPGALTERLATAAPVPTAPSEIAVGIPADTLRQRPDVRAAELRLLAEAANTGKARAARYPTFGLNGSIGLEAASGAMSGGVSLAVSLAASIAQKVFDAGRIRRQIEIQTAVQEQALINYQSAVLTALEDVENAMVSIVSNREREAALASAALSARNAASLARNQYEAGLADFQTVLDTERTELSIEDSLAITRADGTSAVIRLYKALGGGWSPAAAATTTAANAAGTQS